MRRGWVLAAALCCASCALFRPEPDDATRLAEWQAQASSLRGLMFKRSVELRWVDEVQMKDVLVEEAGHDLEPARVEPQRDALAALGALAPDTDLVVEILALYSSQTAGIYSPKRHTLFVNRSKMGGLQSYVTGPIVVHELTHALQDQNFPDVLDLMLGLEHEDDVGRALSGTIEGDATVTMLGAFAGANPETKRLEVAEHLRDEMLKQLDDPESEFGRAPRLLAVSLLFPYAYGTVIAAQRWDEAGNAGLDSELIDPPLATLHILRPQTRGAVEFVRLPAAALERAGAGCTVDYTNVAGAVLLRVLFEKSLPPAERDALLDGWRGDRYAKLACGDRWELVWLTRWSSRESAQRFASAYGALAPEIAARTPLSGPAEIVVRDRTALVVTPGVRAQADALLRGAEIRSYARFVDWVADQCFPDNACPSRDPVQRAHIELRKKFFAFASGVAPE